MNTAHKISIVIPCWNEELNVPHFVDELWPVMKKINYDFEVVMSDDGSTDRTVAEIKKIIANHPEGRLISDGIHRGLGATLRAGIAAASGDWIITLDSDLTFHPSLIPALVAAKETHPATDFIIGSPNLGGYGADVPAWRLWISRLANLVYRLLLGRPVTAINQIFRLYTARSLREIEITSVGFDINAEILFKLTFNGKTNVEIPAELTSRVYGVSKLNYAREIRRHLALLFKIVKWKFFGFKTTR